MKRSQSLVPPSSTSQTAQADDGKACRECRRRRVVCDGTMPECAVCQRYRRHCLYDKHSRTRLTRKQLTILENRLEKAEALLRNQFSREQLAELLDGTSAIPPQGQIPLTSQIATPSTHGPVAPAETPSSVLTAPTDLLSYSAPHSQSLLDVQHSR